MLEYGERLLAANIIFFLKAFVFFKHISTYKLKKINLYLYYNRGIARKPSWVQEFPVFLKSKIAIAVSVIRPPNVLSLFSVSQCSNENDYNKYISFYIVFTILLDSLYEYILKDAKKEISLTCFVYLVFNNL